MNVLRSGVVVSVANSLIWSETFSGGQYCAASAGAIPELAA